MRYLGYCALVTFVLITACKRQTRWDVKGLVPLFNTNLTLNDIDANYLLPKLGDTSYTLVYDNLVYSSNYLDVKTPDTSIQTAFTLKRLKLSDRSLSQRITLGQINPLFNILNGQTQVIPAQDLKDLSPQTIDASAFFETATLDSGYLDITLKNELPVNVSLIIFELQNADDQTVVARDSFKNISALGGTATKSISLKNKTVKKTLNGVIKKLVTEASSGAVLIDASKGVEVTLTVRNLSPRAATAVFPDQTVLEQNEGLNLDMGGPQVKFFKVRSGKLHLKIISTIQENMGMDFSIPSATKNGNFVQRTVKLAGAPPTGNTTAEETIDLAGYLIDFRGVNPNVTDTVNTFHQIMRVYLESSGKKVSVTLRDSIRINYSLEALEPEYAIGYLGKTKNSTGNGSAPFDLFKGLSGDLKLKNFTASVLIKNTVGAFGSITVNKLEAENIFTGNKVTLNATGGLLTDILVPQATMNNFNTLDYTASEKLIVLDQSNSNIKNFVENLPQKINYNLDITTDPNGNVNNFKDWVTEKSAVDIYLRLESDASFQVNGVFLRDTQSINFGSIKQNERLKYAELILECLNAFPFEVEVGLDFLDKNNNYLTSTDATGENRIKAGNGIYNRASANATSSSVRFVLSRSKMEAIQKADKIVIVAKIKGNGQQQKIYNNYFLKVKANGKFEYETRM